MILNSKKTLLAKLYFKNIELFNKKIDLLNISVDEIILEIEKEQTRINSLKKIGEKSVRKSLSLSDHTFYINGSPYYSAEPISPNKKNIPSNQQKQGAKKKTVSTTPKNKTSGNVKKKTKSKTIFIDGDNHIDEGQKGIECTSKDIKIIAVFSQGGAKNKFDKKYVHKPNVSSKLVEPGSQAVDNKIKTEVGSLLKKGNQDIGIVSQDKGFAEFVRRKRNKKLDNYISTYKSVKGYLNRNNKKLKQYRIEQNYYITP